MHIRTDRTPHHRFHPRALGRTGAWLLGACMALGACAEPAPTGTPVDDAAARTQATSRAVDAPNAKAPDATRAPAMAAPTSTAASGTAVEPQAAGHDTPEAAKVARGPDAVADPALPRMQVHKSPTCGCCSLWVDHVRKAGFVVDVHDTNDLLAIKQRLGVPADAQSCHTAEVGGLVVEGHVPAEDIKRALAARDGTRALVLPGMPVNSPGMEVPGIDAPPYTVERITADGAREPFATHGGDARGR